MIDKRLYCETFSRLCASEEAKKEVIQMMHEKKHGRSLPKVLRAGAIAAAMTMALAVTAGAANLATGGEFFHTLRQVWTDGYETRYEGRDTNGNSMEISVTQGATVCETGDGRLMLRAAGEEVDITGDLEEKGEARFEKVTDQRTVQVTVSGTREDWVLEETVTEEDGTVYRSQLTSDEAAGGVVVSVASGMTMEREEATENGTVRSRAVTVTEGGDGGMTLTDGEGHSFQVSGSGLPAAEVPEP